jgi:hypothetical protein
MFSFSFYKQFFVVLNDIEQRGDKKYWRYWLLLAALYHLNPILLLEFRIDQQGSMEYL